MVVQNSWMWFLIMRWWKILALVSTLGLSVGLGGCVPERDFESFSSGTSDKEVSRLRGLGANEVRSTLGRPAFVRRDHPGEIWQYRGVHCTLDVFLYTEETTQTVAYSSLRGEKSMDENRCLDEIVGRKRPTG